jgi:aminomethyltransferase
MADYKRTPLHPIHLDSGARFVHFGGWEMPLYYASISKEHLSVRTRVGLFDVSHMGEFLIRGNAAQDFLQQVTTNDVRRLRDGKAQYTTLLQQNGTVIDDLLLYRLSEDRYMMVVNAANTESDFKWLQKSNTFGVHLEDLSDQTALLAVQGPLAKGVLQSLTRFDLAHVAPFSFVEGQVCGVSGILSRTGYTGEDGYEFCFPKSDSQRVWETLLDAGESFGILPAGLGARNTLRMEAGLLLYGNDLNHTTTPLEAGIESIVSFEKGNFIGREALIRQRQGGIRKKLVGFRMLGREIARDGYPIRIQSQLAGQVTSGGPSFTLKCNIGMAYLPVEHATLGTRFQIQIRNRFCDAEVVALPFYKGRRSL